MEPQTFIIRDREERAKATEAVRNLTGDPIAKVVISEFKEARSGAQRRLQWLWHGFHSTFFEESKGKTFPPTAFHVFFTEMFQPQESIEGPDGKWITRTKSTADNNTKEMHLYLEKVGMYSANEWGCVLPIPDDLKGAFVAGQTIETFNGKVV